MNRIPDETDTMTESQILYDQHPCFHISELKYKRVDEDMDDLVGVCTLTGEKVNGGECETIASGLDGCDALIEVGD